MYRKVTIYTTADGKCPVTEFIDSQPAKVAQKIAWILKAVQEIEKNFQKHTLRNYQIPISTKSELS